MLVKYNCLQRFVSACSLRYGPLALVRQIRSWEDHMKKMFTTVAASALCLAAVSTTASANDIVCLITKTDSNPFFVKMKEGATAKAEELGMTLKAYAGKIDGDNESQVAAIETCIADGASGILLT